MVFEGTDPASVSWAGRTGEEIRSLGAAEGSVAVIPLGTVEDHGKHLPVSTDSILVSEVANGGAERVAEDVPVLVTPTVWSGYSVMHAMFEGTITVGLTHLLSLLQDIGQSVLESGFDAMLIVNGHGGTIALSGCAVYTIGPAHPEKEVTGLTYFNLVPSLVDEIRDSDLGGMYHGGEFETSLMLHLRPELVGEERIDDPKENRYRWHNEDLASPGVLTVYQDFDQYTSHGALGVPSAGSAEKGKRLFDGITDELGAIITAIHEESI
jgi:creatinine amidohydrolase